MLLFSFFGLMRIVGNKENYDVDKIYKRHFSRNTNFKEHRTCGELCILENSRKLLIVVALQVCGKDSVVTFYGTNKTIICCEGYNE